MRFIHTHAVKWNKFAYGLRIFQINWLFPRRRRVPRRYQCTIGFKSGSATSGGQQSAKNEQNLRRGRTPLTEPRRPEESTQSWNEKMVSSKSPAISSGTKSTTASSSTYIPFKERYENKTLTIPRTLNRPNSFLWISFPFIWDTLSDLIFLWFFFVQLFNIN